MRRAILKSCLMLFVLTTSWTARPSPEDLYPKHIDAKTEAAIKRGLDWLAKTQTQDGNWNQSQDTITYPTSMVALAGMAYLSSGSTPSRGPYADNIKHAELWLMSNAKPSGLITDAAEGSGRPMHGHGFSPSCSSHRSMEWKPTRERATHLKNDHH